MNPLEGASSIPESSGLVHNSSIDTAPRYEREQVSQQQQQQQQQNEIINHHLMENNNLHHLPIPSHSIPVNHLVNTYQHYIHSAPSNLSHLPLNYEDVGKDDSSKKRRRTNYKDPENSNKLNAALNSLINQQDGEGQKDLKTVSKLYNLPYNTLRDNFLK